MMQSGCANTSNVAKEIKPYCCLASCQGPRRRGGHKLGSALGRDPSNQESQVVSSCEFILD